MYLSKTILPISNFHSLANGNNQNYETTKPGGTFQIAIRTRVRNCFPRPSEKKRVTRHGWWKRMSTPEGRRILMNRILKGKWVYSH